MISPLVPQRLIALPFLGLGAWCLLLPGQIETLTILPGHQHNSPTTALLIGCFGAQAILAGLFAMFSRFTAATFAAYGIALLPFFWFNYHFVYVTPIFNAWLTIDFAANLAMLAMCVWGWILARRA